VFRTVGFDRIDNAVNQSLLQVWETVVGKLFACLLGCWRSGGDEVDGSRAVGGGDGIGG
jgi:hypothetical protein